MVYSGCLGREVFHCFRTRYPVFVQHYYLELGARATPFMCERANITENLLKAALIDGEELFLDEFIAIACAFNELRHNPLPLDYLASSSPGYINDPATTRYRTKREKLTRRFAKLVELYGRTKISLDYWLEGRFCAVRNTIQAMDNGETILNAEYWWAFECLHDIDRHARYELRNQLRIPRKLEQDNYNRDNIHTGGDIS